MVSPLVFVVVIRVAGFWHLTLLLYDNFCCCHVAVATIVVFHDNVGRPVGVRWRHALVVV